MSSVTFLAPVAGITANTVYGPGSILTLDGATNEPTLRALQRDGKAALVWPDARNVRVTALGTTTATIAWTTDQTITNMRVDYGTAATYGSQTAATPATGVGDVVCNLTGLTTGTLYHYRVALPGPGGTTYTLSPDYTFTTL